MMNREPEGLSQTAVNDWPATDSSAASVFSEFSEFAPMIISATTPAGDAEKTLCSAHEKLRFVVDSRNYILGVISMEDFCNGVPVSEAGKGQFVADYIRLRFRLKAFEFDELQNISIAEVIKAFKECGYRQCMVIDRSSNKVRGLISAHDVASKLKVSLNKVVPASSHGLDNFAL